MNDATLVLAAGATPWLVGVIALVLGLGIGYAVFGLVTGRTLRQAKTEAEQLRTRAEADAKTAAEAIRVEADRAALSRKEEVDKELEQARGEQRETERRLAKREDTIDRKEQAISSRETEVVSVERSLAAREEELQSRSADLDSILEQQMVTLQEVASMSRDEAREALLARMEEECKHEAAKLTRRLSEKAEEDAGVVATEAALQALQRCATEITSESTVRTVAIPSDDLKGRIIGREGRNIRAFERVSGVDVIVDDTPGVIVVSCFDKVRQQIAVESLERLVSDGRMHPARIEEVVSKVQKEVTERIQKYGKDAVLEVNLRGVNPKIAEAMGKLHYRTSYGQNVLKHSIEVAFLSQIIAEQLGLDGTVARRCGFLHDIGKAMDHEMEGGHPKIGMDFAKQYGEKDPVLNVIGGHHGDIPSTNFYTPIIMAADAISSARPGARRESMEKYVQRLNELQDIALGMPGVSEAYAVQAGREVRVMVDAQRVGDDEAYLIAHQIAKRVEQEMTFPGEIKVTVLRETRAIELAR